MQKYHIPKKILEKYQIRDIYLFGSEVLGTKHPDSDFDIGVIFTNGLPKNKNMMKFYGDVHNDLISLFPNKKLDLVFLQEAPLDFQFKALTEGELLQTTDKEKNFEYLEYIVNLYRDQKYFIEMLSQKNLPKK